MVARCNDCRWWIFGSLAVLSLGCASVPPAPAPPPLPTSAAAGDTTIVAIAPAGKASCNLWEFSGVEQAVGSIAAGKHRIRDHIASKLGMRFPGLEPTPPIKLITDPANLTEDAPPTVKAAAEVKIKEDQAEQKIKGIRYLATIGCGGCYPQVEDALLASLEDCTEAVRYETVLAIRKTTGRECSFCSEMACCSEKVQTKLLKMVTLIGDCYPEPSARVRRQARLALRQCGPVVPVFEEDLDPPDSPVLVPEPLNGNGPPPVIVPEVLTPEDIEKNREDTPPLPVPDGNVLSMSSLSFSSVDRVLQPW